MKKDLNNDLFQTYSSDNDSLRVDILYNDSFDFFYFETYRNGDLIKGNTRIVNEFENEFLRFTSPLADTATFETVSSFSLEFLDV